VRRVAHAIADFTSLVRGASRDHFAGIIDFSYQHYALGDLLTSQVNLACLAVEHDCRGLDLYIIIDPRAPAARAQSFITPENYLTHLDNVFPALLVSPMLRSIRLIRDPLTAGLSLVSLIASRVPMWPPMFDHLRRRMTYPLDHGIINRFHRRHGYVPKLEAPRGYAGWAQRFIQQHYAGRFLVCINPRQSRLTPTPAVTERDAPLEEWYEFLRAVGCRYPDVHFFMLGGFAEWEPQLLRMDNISIPRAMGLTLAHELALLTASNLFMGTSSGFATMATFCGVPYVITSIEPFFARYAGVEPNALRYPFADVHQCLVWQREDARLLLHQFQNVYHAFTEVAS
jgi:hypothetical protein